MAKKDSKKKKSGKKDKAPAGAVEAVEAVRSAVERTFTATAGGAQSLRGPAQEFAGEVAAAANRIREVLEDRVVDELKLLTGRGHLVRLAQGVQDGDGPGLRDDGRRPGDGPEAARRRRPDALRLRGRRPRRQHPRDSGGRGREPALGVDRRRRLG